MKSDEGKLRYLLSMSLKEKGFDLEEVDMLFYGYGRYSVEGMTKLLKYIYQTPDCSKQDIVEMAIKIQDYCWNMDYTETENQIRKISDERGYPEQLVKGAMLLVDLYKNSKPVLKLFETITDDRELAIEIIRKIEKYQEEKKKLEIFVEALNRVEEVFEAKKYSRDLFYDVKLTLIHTYNTHRPVEYDVVVNLVDEAENEDDLIDKFNLIFKVVAEEIGLNDNSVVDE